MTTPVRSVFHCSAKARSDAPSLNDLLHTGPSLVAGLHQVLLRLRLHGYATLCDVEKAFLIIKLHPDDRNVTRFLWFENPTDSNSKIVTYRFTVALFGATCSQFLLNATVLKHLSAFKDCEFFEERIVH